MPTYDYECGACQHAWEEFQSMSSKPLRKCPACGRLKAKRVIGPGAGFIFKGSGFYLTDYRSESYKSGAEADRKSQTPPSTAAGTSDSGKSSEQAKTPDSGSSGSAAGGAASAKANSDAGVAKNSPSGSAKSSKPKR